MGNIYKGRVFILGDNIDTDQIIPAKFLVYDLEDSEEKKEYGRNALSGLPEKEYGDKPFVEEGAYKSEYSVIIAGENFGCGSSREHAPAALRISGVKFIVATNFARIFYRNCIDGGFLVPVESKQDLTKEFKTGDFAVIDVDRSVIQNINTSEEFELFDMGKSREIVDAGGLFKYARKMEMI
ncbi:3-isopropylmalate dehydratase [candidate division KSB1 bacterium]|nr:MAG: 3-isopropylmalate dehydratase [candidate division KSB1 bacterium]